MLRIQVPGPHLRGSGLKGLEGNLQCCLKAPTGRYVGYGPSSNCTVITKALQKHQGRGGCECIYMSIHMDIYK